MREKSPIGPLTLMLGSSSVGQSACLGQWEGKSAVVTVRSRFRYFIALGAVALVGALPFAPSASAQLSATSQPAKICKGKRCHHPPASHLRAGEYCKKCAQRFYHRHGYTCKKASDGRLRLFTI